MMSPRDARILLLFYIGLGIVALCVTLYCRSTATGRQSVYSPPFITGVTITAYCPGSCCNDRWAGLTAYGRPIAWYQDRGIPICAVDPKVIKMFSYVEYQGVKYFAVDVGGKIKKKHIDLLKNTHRDAVLFGVRRNQTIRIFLPGEKYAYKKSVGDSRGDQENKSGY